MLFYLNSSPTAVMSAWDSFSKYVALVRSSLEFSRYIKSESAEIKSKSEVIKNDISVYDALLGPIPPSALKKKPRPSYMTLTTEDKSLAENLLFHTTHADLKRVVADRNNIQVTVEKLQCLRDREWLNDEVINFYFDMLNDLSASSKKTSYLWNSFFWLKLSSDGNGYNYKAVQRWTSRKRIDIFNFERILVPMNIGKNHWALGVVELKERCIKYYDSLSPHTVHASFAEYIIRYLEDEFRDKRKDQPCPDFLGTFTTCLVDPPQQRNGYDCGVFTCMNAECITAGRYWIDFDQSMIPEMRRKIAAQISAGRIN